MKNDERSRGEEDIERIFQRSKSKIRREVEDLLKNVDIAQNRGLVVINMSNGEAYNFDSFPEAVEFVKCQKGRWYITTSWSAPQK